MTVQSTSSSKTELRQAFRRLLREARPEPAANDALNQRLIDLIRRLGGRSLWGGYCGTDFEPDVGPAMRELGSEVEWALPRVEGESLAFYRVEDFSSLVPNQWGILEPDPRRAGGSIEVDRLAGLLVPGVAFDRFGNRLGRGRGYYDRALAASQYAKYANNKTIKIGVGFGRQISPREIPHEDFDQPMDWVVTEAQVFHRASSPDADQVGRKKEDE